MEFLSLKNLSQGQFLGSSNSRRYHWTLKLLVAIKKSEDWEQKCVWLFYYFSFERNYVWRLKFKNISFNKSETESKTENPIHTFRETNLCASFHIRIANEKENCDVLELSKEKTVHFFFNVYFVSTKSF